MATIHDVARAAEVSIATVSRVLNDNPRVSEHARRRVWAAASELDYWPNGAARSLTTSRTNTLGVLLPDLFGEFFSEVIRGIDSAAREENRQLLISSSHLDTDAILSAARPMLGRIDGLLVMAPDIGSVDSIRRIAQRFPVVLLNPMSRLDGCAAVSVANFDGAYAVVEHLVALGHRTIAMVRGPRGNVDAVERLRGFRRALTDFDIEGTSTVVVPGDFDESSGYRAAQVILECTPRPTAVFAANDSMAIGLLGALREAGVRVPEDMAVAGFDDIAMAQYLTPPLTTVHVDAYELGVRSVRLLTASEFVPGSLAGHDVLPAPLVVRSSCGSADPGNGSGARSSGRDGSKHGTP